MKYLKEPVTQLPQASHVGHQFEVGSAPDSVRAEQRSKPNRPCKIGCVEGELISPPNLCLSPQTLIHTADGIPKPIREVQSGDGVITSKGRIAAVKAVWQSARRNELTSEIWLWGEFSPVSGVRDHRILCPEGFREARDIRDGDYVCRPVRPFIEGQKTRTLVQYTVGGRHTKRPQSYEDIRLNFDWGWILGFYLAEGTVKNNGHAAGFTEVSFGIDRDEESMVEERLRRVIPEKRKIGRYRFNSRTSVRRVSWSGLARFIGEHFGHGDTKRVPDWAWDTGRDFCRGLLAGYIQGDGHLAVGRNDVSATSVRPAILLQMRELAASLGYGWSSIYYREPGIYYERNCRASWNWHMVSEVAARCKADLGWQDTAKRPPAQPTHWRYSKDSRFVHIQVERNLSAFSETFYHLEVNAAEHDFCTLNCCLQSSTMGSQVLPENQPSIDCK